MDPDDDHDSDDENDKEEVGSVPVDDEMVAAMKQMDEELLIGGQRVDRIGGDQDIEDKQLAEDAHVLLNLVESVGASAGGPGPVRNILREIGKPAQKDC